MRKILQAVSAVLLAGVVQAPTLAAGETEAPNILFIVADDLGVRDTAVGGSEYYLTPAIDQLAADGVSFAEAYAAHPRCVPSRYGLITGRYPARAGSPGGFYGVERERQTVAETLRDAGYGTYFVGKWHLTGGQPGDANWSGNPDEHGFDKNVAGGEAGAPSSYSWPYNQKVKGGEKIPGSGKEKPIVGLEEGEPGEMLTDRLTDEAGMLLRQHREQSPDKPFFLMLSHYGVHTPFEDTKEATQEFRKRLRGMGELEGAEFIEKDGQTKRHQDHPVYAAMIKRLDDSVGSMTALLDELGLAEDTIIVFTSDHGGLSNRGNNRGLATSNLPWRAGKGHLYEGGVRVPLIVRWPGRAAAGTETDALTIGTDFHATFAELAGADAPEDLDSVSLVPVLGSGHAEAWDRSPIFWHSPRARPRSTGDHNASAIRDGDWKLLHFYGGDGATKHDELYDLSADPYEENNLAEEKPGKAKELREKLDAWLAEVDAVEPKAKKARKHESEPDEEGEED